VSAGGGDVTDEHFLRRAIALAERAVRDRVGQPFGAVVVRDGRIVGEGCNLVTSTCDPTAHAEIVALRDACRALATTRLEGCTIYASCEPCAMCLAALHLARLERLVFASSAEDAAAFGFDSRYLYGRLRRPAALPTTRLLADEGKLALARGAGAAPPTKS
jgi:tRNA(Arg) A34 adenosine deaminase TadA